VINKNLWYQEGNVRFQVGNAFYNPHSKLVRDLGVLTASIEQEAKDSFRILDALGGCGVRSLRYWQESQADYIWINEGNPDHNSIISQNLASAIAMG